mmetsp:Transcript_6435/g.10916  ORF Transcript_6435/g.10916 Transcript_6435/m.10916 type:complete len:228 (-) Transcript_6435:635-1318(-)
MARILLKEEQPNCPIVGIHGLIKLTKYEKEMQALLTSATGEKRELQLMQLASEVPLNVMFLALGGKVYKYDLVTKECLFEFNTFEHCHMQLYDGDDKLMIADNQQIRLWDFYDNKEDIPEFVTRMEATLKIDCLKVNKCQEEAGERKGLFYYVVACKDEFKVYIGRLDLLLQGDVDNKMDRISSIEYGIDLKHLYIGTEKGLIMKFELPSPQQVAEEYEVAHGDLAP